MTRTEPQLRAVSRLDRQKPNVRVRSMVNSVAVRLGTLPSCQGDFECCEPLVIATLWTEFGAHSI